MLVQAQEEVGEGSANPTDPHHTPIIIQPSTSQPKKKHHRKSKKKNTKVPQPSHSTEPIADEAPNVENVPTHSNDPLLNGEDRLKLNELMKLCTSLSQRFLDLETTKTSQAVEITELKERVKKLEKKGGSRITGSEDYTRLVDLQEWFPLKLKGRYDDNLMFDTGVLDNEQDMAEKEVDIAKKEVSTADLVTTIGEVVTTTNVVVSTAEVTTDSTTTTTVDELTLAQTLIEIKAAKPRVRRVMM
ncbi:hypothetical protein Tco_1344775 [Tanacetum coccineum]